MSEEVLTKEDEQRIEKLQQRARNMLKYDPSAFYEKHADKTEEEREKLWDQLMEEKKRENR